MDLIVVNILVFLIMFQIKHFLVDFIIQISDPDHIKKFAKEEWFLPLFKHSFHHGLGTAAIVTLYLSYCNVCPFSLKFYTIVLGSFLFDTIVHFCIDRLKASPNFGGKYAYPSKNYFMASGLDQMLHHLTHYSIIFGVLFFIEF